MLYRKGYNFPLFTPWLTFVWGIGTKGLAGSHSYVHLCLFEVYLSTDTCTIYVHSQMPDLNTESKYKCPRKKWESFCWGRDVKGYFFFQLGFYVLKVWSSWFSFFFFFLLQRNHFTILGVFSQLWNLNLSCFFLTMPWKSSWSQMMN